MSPLFVLNLYGVFFKSRLVLAHAVCIYNIYTSICLSIYIHIYIYKMYMYMYIYIHMCVF